MIFPGFDIIYASCTVNGQGEGGGVIMERGVEHVRSLSAFAVRHLDLFPCETEHSFMGLPATGKTCTVLMGLITNIQRPSLIKCDSFDIVYLHPYGIISYEHLDPTFVTFFCIFSM